ncbi:MAG: hypothetical protein K9K39_07505 [Desulfohalobiaceae bacterium]|nr:hypothetical protein [Desulfohalobiaceae bacterium]
MTVTESDWKIFKKIHAAALERFSQQILQESRAICDNESLSGHERYIRLYKHIKKRDKEIARAFNDYRRSTAKICLKHMVNMDLVTDEEFSQLSSELQAFLRFEM